MKKTFVGKRVFAISLATAILSQSFISCKDVSSINPDELSSNQIAKDPYKYTLDNLTKIGMGILKSSQDDSFKRIVYSEIEKRFDGDENVLIKTLDEKVKKINIDIVNNIPSNGNIDGKSAMSAFKNIDNNEYFPQIYIPFFDELKAKGKIGVSNPTVVIFDGNEKNSGSNGVPGYIYDANGKMRHIVNVKENYARDNEVWVISLNERTIGTPQGVVLKSGRISSKQYEVASNKVASPNHWEWKIESLKVLVDKDNNFLMGDSEVCMKAVVDFNPVNGISSNYLYRTNGDGYLSLGSFSVGNMQTINKEIVRSHKSTNSFWWGDIIGDNAYNGSKNMYYIIYEDDNWPATMRTASISRVGGGEVQIQYRSEDLPYDQSTLYAPIGPTWANGYTIPFLGINTPQYGINPSNSEIIYGIRVNP